MMGLFTRRITERKVRRQGKRDGRPWRWDLFSPGSFFRVPKSPSPPADETEPALYEQRLREYFDDIIKDLATKWEKEDEKLKDSFCDALAEYQQARAAQKKETKEAKEAVQLLETHRGELEQMGSPELGKGFMVFLLVTIGIVEAPLNAVIFRILGEGWGMTLLMATGIAFLIPLLAHLFGSRLRLEERRPLDTWLLVLAPLVVLGLLASVSYVRAQYLKVDVVEIDIPIGLTEGTILFLAINIAFFFAAMMVSYNGTHPRHGVYVALRSRFRELEKAAAREVAESREAHTRLETAWKAYQRHLHRRRNRYRHYRELATQSAEILETCIIVYRNANVDARPDGGVPPAFRKEPPEVGLPSALARDLPDEDCATAREDQSAQSQQPAAEESGP